MKLHCGTHGLRLTTWLGLSVLVAGGLNVSSGLFNPVDAQDATTVILVRHAEKADDPGNRDPELSQEGRQRARLLAGMLSEAGVTRIYSTPFHRTRDTARPLSDLIGVEIMETALSRTWIEDMAARISTQDVGETVLVVGHSNSTPGAVNALTGSHFEDFDESDYENYFIVTLNPDGSSSVVRMRFGL